MTGINTDLNVKPIKRKSLKGKDSKKFVNGFETVVRVPFSESKNKEVIVRSKKEREELRKKTSNNFSGPSVTRIGYCGGKKQYNTRSTTNDTTERCQSILTMKKRELKVVSEQSNTKGEARNKYVNFNQYN